MLTDLELRALDLTAELARCLPGIIGTGPAAGEDLRELHAHIHGIQHTIMAQAAARAYPDKFRLLGGAP